MNLVAVQVYDTDINTEYVIKGNAAILKCVLPSYLSDYLSILSWKVDDEEINFHDSFGTNKLKKIISLKTSKSSLSILKFSFVFMMYNFCLRLIVVIQHYDTDVNKEYVIRGNSGILRCQTPSFVGDHVEVISWITDNNETFYANDPNLGRRLRLIN
jgi:hypothetical protein